MLPANYSFLFRILIPQVYYEINSTFKILKDVNTIPEVYVSRGKLGRVWANQGNLHF